MRNSIGYYAGFLMLLAVLGGVTLAVVHVVKVVRKVRNLISQATDEPDPVDAQLDTNPVEPLLTLEECFDEESNETAADILLWESELNEIAAIHKYMRRMDRRPVRGES